MQIQGKSVLFDPVFAKRCSPLKFVGPKRFRSVPIKIPELPRIDFCCISHDHFDHLNKASVRLLNKCWPNIKWCGKATMMYKRLWYSFHLFLAFRALWVFPWGMVE
eukprot:m.208762 g.208762  ORF g.208762 m.208762 type:complete len:106 (+) comp16933_c6_seq2:415-732(+)